MDLTVETLRRMCGRVEAEILSMDRFQVSGGREVAEAHIKLEHRPSSCAGTEQLVTQELRVVFVGDANAGKSTLLGILTYGGLDNGAGSVRMGLLRHRHEILSGHTSSVSVEPLVFMAQDSELIPVRPEEFESTEHLTLTLQRRYMDAPKVIQFFDMPGKPRLSRSVLSSLTSVAGPDLVCVVVSCEGSEEDRMQCVSEYLAVLEPLGIPVFVVLTKSDLLSSEELARMEHAVREAYGLPTYSVSALNGIGVESLVYVLLERSPLESPIPSFGDRNLFLVENVKVYEDVGTVLKGTVMRGVLEKSEGWFVGPQEDGSFSPVTLETIHRLRIPVQKVDARLMASVAIKVEGGLKVAKGMFLTNCKPNPVEMRRTFEIKSHSFILKDLDKTVKGILVLNGVRWQAGLVQGEEGRIQVEVEDGRVFLMSGMKYLISTHLGILAGII